MTGQHERRAVTNGGGQWSPGNREVDVPVLYRICQGAAQAQLHFDPHIRMAGAESRQAANEGLLGQCAADKADRHFAGFAACRALCRAGGSVGVKQCGPGFDQKSFTCFGQCDAAMRAQKQLHAKAILQRADVLAQRRLGHAQALCGTANMKLFGCGHKVSELAKIQCGRSI